MKRIFAALIISLVALSASAQEHLKIKGVPIDGNLTSFLTKLKNAGLKTNAKYSEALGQPVLSGEFARLGNCNFIFLTTKDNTVCKVVVVSEPYSGWVSARSRYNELKESLAAKYGEGKSFEYFRSPYYEGDGYELSAIEQGKGTYQTFFNFNEGSISISLDADNTREGYLTVNYEDGVNMARFIKERDQKVNDDI